MYEIDPILFHKLVFFLHLEEQIRLLKNELFGRKSEKHHQILHVGVLRKFVEVAKARKKLRGIKAGVKPLADEALDYIRDKIALPQE